GQRCGAASPSLGPFRAAPCRHGTAGGIPERLGRTGRSSADRVRADTELCLRPILPSPSPISRGIPEPRPPIAEYWPCLFLRISRLLHTFRAPRRKRYCFSTALYLLFLQIARNGFEVVVELFGERFTYGTYLRYE